MWWWFTRRSATPSRRVGERKVTTEVRARIYELYADGSDKEEIADELGVSVRTVERYLAQLRQDGEGDPVELARRQLAAKEAQIQLQALESPEVKEKVVAKLFGPPSDKPVDQQTIERVLDFLERQGRTVVDKRWLSDLEERARKTEEALAEADEEIDDLRDQLRAGGGEEGAVLSLIRDLVPTLRRQGAVPGGGVPELPPAAAGSPASAPERPAADSAAVLLSNLTALEPAEAARIVYTSAANGMEVGGVSLAQAVMLLLSVSSPQQVAALLAGVPGLEAVQTVAQERPEWVTAFLTALRALHDERTSAPAAPAA